MHVSYSKESGRGLRIRVDRLTSVCPPLRCVSVQFAAVAVSDASRQLMQRRLRRLVFTEAFLPLSVEQWLESFSSRCLKTLQ